AEASRTTHAGAAFHFRINFYRQGVALSRPLSIRNGALARLSLDHARSRQRSRRALSATCGHSTPRRAPWSRTKLQPANVGAQQCPSAAGKKLRLADVKPMFVQLRSGKTVRTVAWKVRK